MYNFELLPGAKLDGALLEASTGRSGSGSVAVMYVENDMISNACAGVCPKFLNVAVNIGTWPIIRVEIATVSIDT